MIYVETYYEDDNCYKQNVRLNAEDSATIYFELLTVLREVFSRTGLDEEVVRHIHELVEKAGTYGMAKISS